MIGRSITFVCAIKKAAGMTGETRFHVSKLIEFIDKNPKFRTSEVYKPKPISRQHTRGRKVSASRKSSALKS